MNTKRDHLRTFVNRVAMVVVLPLALLHTVVAARSGARAARRVARGWIRVAGRLTGVRFVTAGCPSGESDGMRVIVANHSSLIDVAAILAADPAATFVAGADLFRVPLLAGAMRALHTVPVDRRSRNRTQLRLPLGMAHGQLSLVVFPEGRIAPAGQRLPFHRSAFALAIENQVPVLPVAIHSASEVLPPRSRVGVRAGTVTAEFLAPIPTAGLTLKDRHRLCQQAERQILAALGARRGLLGAGTDRDLLRPAGRTRSANEVPGQTTGRVGQCSRLPRSPPPIPGRGSPRAEGSRPGPR